MTVAWVIGGSGLLGRAVGAAAASRAGWTVIDVPSISWMDPVELVREVRRNARTLFDSAVHVGADWTIIWAAGAGVTSSAPESLERELDQLATILETIGSELRPGAVGSIFYASSAGGVYGGSPHPPFTENSPTGAISPYGRFKLRAEGTVAEFAERHRVSALIGRIANLYGPGQKLEKMQGLISQIAKGHYSTAPASIYVSLDTMRDYIFVDDCAYLICDTLERLREESAVSGPALVTKILASGQGVTIAMLLGHFKNLVKGNPHVMLGSSANAALQAHDLRLRSEVWPELDRRQLTPLPAGMHATMLDILIRIERSKSFT